MEITPCTVKTGARKQYQYLFSPRCGAKTRHGTPCNAPAIKNKKRCRMHGGKGSGAPKGSQNALKHGCYAAESIDLLTSSRNVINSSLDLIKKLTNK